MQNKTGLEKGKATFAECGYIIFVRWKLVWIADEADYAEDAD